MPMPDYQAETFKVILQEPLAYSLEERHAGKEDLQVSLCRTTSLRSLTLKLEEIYGKFI